jgi:hypothetical protein
LQIGIRLRQDIHSVRLKFLAGPQRDPHVERPSVSRS